MLLIAEKGFRRLEVPERVQIVGEGAGFAAGQPLGEDGRKAAA